MPEKIIGAYEAKTKLGELLSMVSDGQAFTITKHGMPIAALTQPSTGGSDNVAGIIEAIKTQRKKFAKAFSKTSIKELIVKGRK